MRATASAMAGALIHRGPDSSGVWADDRYPFAFGHRRLSILDLSAEGHQPMISSSGRYVIAYNGEIYNFAEVRKKLGGRTARGTSFRGHSDTEVLLEAIDAWGFENTLSEINGMFAFALWDRERHSLSFARDRLGKKPLYIGWAGDDLVFASELKALGEHERFESSVDRNALTLYLKYAGVPAPYTIYEDVWQLPPGFALTLSAETMSARRNPVDAMWPFWHHGEVLFNARGAAAVHSENEAIDGFEALLSTCVEDRMVSDVPLGAFLSGGLDSSTVVALMQKIAAQPVKTYSIGFSEAGFDEAPYAKKIAAHLGTDHNELYLGPQDVLDSVPRLPELYDEPFADISQLPTYLLARFARSGVTVALSGDGGDEMFGGYARHFTANRIRRLTGVLPAFARRGLSQAVRSVPVSRWDRLVPGYPQLGDRVHKAADIIAADSQRSIYDRLVSHWPKPEKLVVGASVPELLMDRAGWEAGNLSFPEKMMYWDALSYLPNDILVKVDRATMAVSLEARAPLLDPRVYAFAWSLPLEYKIRGGQGKWLLRRVLERHVPMELFERPKQGFNMPVGQWLRGPLREWAESLLSAERLRREGFLNPGPVQDTWQEHLAGRGNHATKLWTVLMFEAWLDKYQ